MASKMIVELIDDIDGGPAVETISFGVNGKHYEIDLNSENASIFHDSIGGFIDHARAGSGKKRAGAAAARSGLSREESTAIRDWAAKNGYEVAGRGRLPGRVVAAYNDRNAAA